MPPAPIEPPAIKSLLEECYRYISMVCEAGMSPDERDLLNRIAAVTGQDPIPPLE